MSSYLMFLTETDEEKDFLSKVYNSIKPNSNSQIECLAIDQDNKMYGVSLLFFHEMRDDKEYTTRDITYKEFKVLALRHTTSEITLT